MMRFTWKSLMRKLGLGSSAVAMVRVKLAVYSALTALLFGAHSAAHAEVTALAKPIANADVCGEPQAPCSSSAYAFAAYDLSCCLSAQLSWQTAHNSRHFYAILLSSVKAIQADPGNPNDDSRCGGYVAEARRLAVQAMFPQRKVFASRHGCRMVWYNNVNNTYNFLAVFAGTSFKDAKLLLRTINASGRFPGANIRQMQVVVDNGH